MIVLQLVEDFRHADDATRALDATTKQIGYLGGRIISPSLVRLTWRLQAFFQDEPDVDWFPDGMRRVFLPFSLLHLIETKDT